MIDYPNKVKGIQVLFPPTHFGGIQGFTAVGLQGFIVVGLQGFIVVGFQGFIVVGLQGLTAVGLQRFTIAEIHDCRKTMKP